MLAMNPTPDSHIAQASQKTIRLLIAGAPKAGSTSLLRYLSQHPGLATHSQPEMSYFVIDHEFDAGYDTALTKYFPNAQPDSHLIAKHVHAMFSEDAERRMLEHNPDMQIALLLRNPIKRAHSAYWYCRRRGWETLPTFEQALEAEPSRLKAGWYENRANAYLYNGVYNPHVSRLIKSFGKDRVHVFLTDDMAAGAAQMCRTLFGAAGVDPGFAPDLTRQHNTAAAARSEPLARAMAGAFKSKGPFKRSIRKLIPHRVTGWVRRTAMRANEKRFTPPPMNPDTRDRLIEHFAPHNRALGELIGRDVSIWSQA
jgi:hypothetical protein